MIPSDPNQIEVNLYSDTQTLPTAEMMEAMARAPLGDDVSGLDPTVNELERLAAEKIGMESAMFVASGTMGNLVALLAHEKFGCEAIVESRSHIYNFEAGGISRLAGMVPRPIYAPGGVLDREQIDEVIRGENIHFAPAAVLCLENTHNMAGGIVTPPDRMKELIDLAHERGLVVHVDGARIFNAAVALGVSVADLVRGADSVMFCLSKGLSAPVGSILAGSGRFIERARKYRKMVGGGMRQAGILAAAGIIALEKMVDRLAEDHANARRLAQGIASIPGFNVDLSHVQTNIINVNFERLGLSLEELLRKLLERGVWVSDRSETEIRLVTHRHISSEDVDKAIEAFREIGSERSAV